VLRAYSVVTAFRAHRPLAAVVTAGLVGCVLAPLHVAHPTYPGRNGSIAFNSVETIGEFEVLRRTEAIRPEGGGRRELADFAFPSWSASGRRVFGIDYPLDYRSDELQRLVFADGSGRPRGEVPLPDLLPCGYPRCSVDGPPLVPRGLDSTAPAVSPDGRTVAFVQHDFSPDGQSTGVELPVLWTVHTDGSRLRRLVRGNWPRWTPNGRRIVFQRVGRYGQRNSIASMRPDGTAFRRVHLDAGGDRFLDLSPDGRRVLWWGVITRRGEPQRGLYTSRVSGGGFRRVHSRPDAVAVDSASWSPDGRMIVFSGAGRGGATWIVPAGGGRPRRLLAQPHDGLAWQPLPLPAAH
jgi:dipeptidyl aminopeptidase/acylaminoacyl peptidase